MNEYKIKYQYGTYSGIETVFADEPDEAISKMWRRLKPYMTLPMAYQSAEIIN